MLIPIERIRDFYKKAITGVIHIGAHYGEEYPLYKNIEVKNMMFFEPIKANFERLIENVPHEYSCHNIALGNKKGIIKMFVENANQGMSCSVLQPEGHLKLYPGITFDETEDVYMDRLDNFPFDRKLFNMINIDVQGYELEVFKGARDTLKSIDIIYTEINTDEVYKDCALVGDIDSFLSGFGFVRQDAYFPCPSWGDAIYIKN